MNDDNTMKGMIALMGVVMMAAVLQMILSKPSDGEPPQPPPDLSEFIYTTPLNITVTDQPTSHDIRWTVDVKNIGPDSGVLHINVYQRMANPYRPGYWSSWSNEGSVSDTMVPGDTRTFSGIVGRSAYSYQLMIQSEAGVVLCPLEPLVHICRYCYYLDGLTVSFTTIEELQAHIASEHPQYSPMPPLTYFYVKGLFWPEHFTKYGEDYGRITKWRATCYLSPEVEGSDEHLPESGAGVVDVSVPMHFRMPDGWVGAYHDSGGRIPNSTLFKLYFETDLGWTGFLDYSNWITRIPEGSTIIFEVSASGAGNWRIE